MKRLTRMIGLITALTIFLMSAASAHAEDQSWVSGITPYTAQYRINEAMSLGKEIDTFAFAPNGQWVLVAENYQYYSSKSYFDSTGLSFWGQLLRDYNISIQTISIRDDGEWILVGDGVVLSSSPSQFKPGYVIEWLEYFVYNKNEHIDSIVLDPNGGYVIVHNGESLAIGPLSTPLYNTLLDCKKAERPIRSVAANGDRFVVLTDTWFATSSTGADDDYRYKTISNFTNTKGPMTQVALGTNGKLMLASQDALSANIGPTKIDQLEYLFTDEAGNPSTLWERMAYHGVPGVGFAVIENGDVVAERGYGTRRAGEAAPVHTTTVFHTASMSKMVGSATVLNTARNSDMLDLDDSLLWHAVDFQGTLFGDWLEKISGFKVENVYGSTAYSFDYEKWSDMGHLVNETTPRMLLHHSAGLNRHGIGLKALGTKSLEDVLCSYGTDYDSPCKVSGGDPVEFKLASSGFWYDYSGGGFSVAEALTEAVTGEPFWFTASKSIIWPMGLNRATMSDLPSTWLGDFAYGHDEEGVPDQQMESPGKIAGGLISSAGDYARIVAMLMNDGTYKGKAIMHSDDVAQLMEPSLWFEGDSCNVKADCGSDFFSSLFIDCIRRPTNGGNRQCVGLPIVYNDDWNIDYTNKSRYGTGVRLTASTDADGYPSYFSHGGDQTGYKAKFYGSRWRGLGYAVLINTVCHEKDANKNCIRGAGPFQAEIDDAFEVAYGW